MAGLVAPQLSQVACQEACPGCPVAGQPPEVVQAVGHLLAAAGSNLLVPEARPIRTEYEAEKVGEICEARMDAAYQALRKAGADNNNSAVLKVIKAGGRIVREECEPAQLHAERLGGD